jgi:hypothetical protein
MNTHFRSTIAVAGLISSERCNYTSRSASAVPAKTPREQESLQRHIVATDQQIAALVYELYGLTEEEVRIVEGDT